MAILTSEILFYKSLVVNDASSNGAALSNNEIVSGVKNNAWPDIPQAERTSGSTKYRKVFIKIANIDNLTFLDTRVFVDVHTPGDDAIVIHAGTHTDTQGDLTGSERVYGGGGLALDTTIGITTLVVFTEDAALDYFKDGDLIRITDKANVSQTGNEQYIRLLAAGAVTYNVDEATLLLQAQVDYVFSTADTRVTSVLEYGDVIGTHDSKSITSVAGTYDDTTFPILVDSIGGILDTWTLTFTSATVFNVVGSVTGAVGSGNITTNLAPSNPDFGRPFFTLDFNGFGGSWLTSDIFVFRTLPAAIPLWEKRVVPAGAASLSGNSVYISVDGESA